PRLQHRCGAIRPPGADPTTEPAGGHRRNSAPPPPPTPPRPAPHNRAGPRRTRGPHPIATSWATTSGTGSLRRLVIERHPIPAPRERARRAGVEAVLHRRMGEAPAPQDRSPVAHHPGTTPPRGNQAANQPVSRAALHTFRSHISLNP